MPFAKRWSELYSHPMTTFSEVPIAAPAALAQPPVADASAIALFLDVDGTLVDFADRPEHVHLDPGLPALLGILAARLGGALALVSGRPIAGIDALIGLPDLPAAGLHGAEIRYPNGHVGSTQAMPTPLPALRAQADALASAWPGVLIEHKRNAIALHYRNAPDAAAAVHARALDLLREAGPNWELQPGNHVFELKPAGTSKGTAIAALMREPSFEHRVPWAFGDDFTDEHAFERVNALGGISVIIGARRPTFARYALADPAGMRDWLGVLARQPLALKSGAQDIREVS
jgi:trehalose 6-phosphate phosphatase